MEKKKEKHETMFERIKRVRLEKGLTQMEVARRIGISKSAVSQWESGTSLDIRPNNLRLLAKILNKSMEWLVDGGPEEGLLSYAPKCRLPVLQSEEIQEGWGDTNRAEDRMGFVDAPDNAGPNSFAIIVSGKSMDPEFQEGETVVVDPGKTPRHNDFVVVVLEGRKKPLIRRFVVSDEKIYLECVNSVYGESPIPLTEPPVFMGRVIAKTKLYSDE